MTKKTMTRLLTLTLSLLCTLLPLAAANAAQTLSVTFDRWAERLGENLPAAGFDNEIRLRERSTPIQGLLIWEASIRDRKMDMTVYVAENNKKIMTAILKIPKYDQLPEAEREPLLTDALAIMTAMIWAGDDAFAEADAREAMETLDVTALLKAGTAEETITFKGVPCSVALDAGSGELSLSVGGNR